MVECSDFNREIKRVALMTVCRMVDSQTISLNSSKAQCQSRTRKVESAKIIRTRQLKELAERAKNVQLRML